MSGEPQLWGVATSALQVDGDRAGRGATDWDVFATEPGRVANGDTPDFGADHLRHMSGDVDLLTELGVNAYRFSLSWSRLRPDGRTSVPQAFDVYDRLLDFLGEAGIEPFVTLAHMELPQALASEGGWASRSTIDAFVDYAVEAHARFGDRVRYWCTLNEVPLTTWNGYATNKFPPGGELTALGLPAIHHQLVAHGRAVREMRAAKPHNSYGMVSSVAPCYPATATDADEAAAARVDAVLNRTGTDPLFRGEYPEAALALHRWAGGVPFVADGDVDDLTVPVDYMGVNYYTPLCIAEDPSDRGGDNVPAGIRARPVDPVHLPHTSFGWLVQPEALVDALRRFADEYQVPVFVTENGTTGADEIAADGHVHDQERIEFLRDHLAALEQSRAEGVDVRGYFVWSFLDNFEWAAGYGQRFGLVHVDRDTGNRTTKDSFDWYRSYIAGQREAHREGVPST